MDKLLAKQLDNLPDQPGVYQFYDSSDRLLYVGKAKNLPRRVRSYFNRQIDLSPAKALMVKQIKRIKATPVLNEDEALLLESNLIKQFQPPYNIVLKDDKSWLYLAVDKRETYPRVSLERRANQRGVKYYGPYPSAGSLKYTLNLLKKILGLRTCTNPPDKPCFNARLGRCLGHNGSPGGQAGYLKQLKKLDLILKGHTHDLITEIEQAMHRAAKLQKFEQASKLKNQWLALQRLSQTQSVISVRRENFDALGLVSQGDTASVSLLPVRHGVLLDAKNFLLGQASNLTPEELLTDFLNQYLPLATDQAKELITPFNLKSANYSKIKLLTPRRGYKKKLLKLAANSAATHLNQSLASWQKRSWLAEQGLVELKNLLNLPALPKRIEGYDISNLQGQQAVGSLTVLHNGLPEPKLYRRFLIKNLTKPNDFAMLAQVLHRRFKHNQDWPQPDLIMLDGGAGQLSIVHKVLQQANIKIPLIALAKQNEEIYQTDKKEPLRLALTNPGLRLLITLRDEAHRFGITLHRKRHRQTQIISAWDELPGIGPKLKKKLKQSFSTIQEIKQANLAELEKIIGLTKSKKLKEYLERI